VAAPQAPPVAEKPGAKTVFIVEDNPENLRLMRMALAGENCRIETDCSAESAFRRLATAPPALVLLNTQVLADDGTPLARRLLGNVGLFAVPIVALTEVSAGMRAYPESDARFDGFIRKPINSPTFAGEVRDLLDSLSQPPGRPGGLLVSGMEGKDPWREARNLLDAIEAGLPDSQSCAETQPGLQGLAEAIGDPQHAAVAEHLRQAARLSSAGTVRGRSRFRSLIQHCQELVDRQSETTPGLTELCAGYLDRRRAELGDLERWLKNGDFAALGKAGHNLKGTGAAYGFGELSSLGRAIEAAAKATDSAAIGDLLMQIDSYIGILCPAPE